MLTKNKQNTNRNIFCVSFNNRTSYLSSGPSCRTASTPCLSANRLKLSRNRFTCTEHCIMRTDFWQEQTAVHTVRRSQSENCTLPPSSQHGSVQRSTTCPPSPPAGCPPSPPPHPTAGYGRVRRESRAERADICQHCTDTNLLKI